MLISGIFQNLIIFNRLSVIVGSDHGLERIFKFYPEIAGNW